MLHSEFNMATLRQIQSARRNGALSRGPVTERGREISSANSRKHGATAKKVFVLANESADNFDRLVDSIVAQYEPEGELERELCLNIAYAQWRLRRLSVVETNLFDREMTRHLETVGGADEGLRLASAFESLATGAGTLSLLTHYETRLHRTVQKLIERLEKIQKKRKNEPDSPLPRGGVHTSNITVHAQTETPAIPSAALHVSEH